jgi:hypothetical protein
MLLPSNFALYQCWHGRGKKVEKLNTLRVNKKLFRSDHKGGLAEERSLAALELHIFIGLRQMRHVTAPRCMEKPSSQLKTTLLVLSKITI